MTTPSTADTLRVLIVDDHELIREGLAGAFAPRAGDRGRRRRSAP